MIQSWDPTSVGMEAFAVVDRRLLFFLICSNDLGVRWCRLWCIGGMFHRVWIYLFFSTSLHCLNEWFFGPILSCFEEKIWEYRWVQLIEKICVSRSVWLQEMDFENSTIKVLNSKINTVCNGCMAQLRWQHNQVTHLWYRLHEGLSHAYLQQFWLVIWRLHIRKHLFYIEWLTAHAALRYLGCHSWAWFDLCWCCLHTPESIRHCL